MFKHKSHHFDGSKGDKSRNTKLQHQLKISVNKTFVSMFVLVFSSTLAKSTKCSYEFPNGKVFIEVWRRSLSFTVQKTLAIIDMSSSIYLNH